MSFKYPLVHVDEVTPENMKPGAGWAISEFRLPITGRNGSATTLFHSIFRPGSTHARHRHTRCDEIAVYLRGRGIVGQRDERTEVRPGHCRLMPKGSEHFFYNETPDEDGLVVGFYIGAQDVADTGYEFKGKVTTADLAMLRSAGLQDGILLNVTDVPPLDFGRENGWGISDFRLPIGTHNGSPNALFWAKLEPGDIHGNHRHDRCEVLYYVVDGRGVVGAGEERAALRGGHVLHIPRGAEHFLANDSDSEALEVIGVYTGAGSIDESGYVYLGEAARSDTGSVHA